MSSVITGRRIDSGEQQRSVTWVALAGVIQAAVVLGGMFLFAGDLRARVTGLEKYKEMHQAETVHRGEFDKLDGSAIRRDEFTLLKEQINRIESKLDALAAKR